MWIKLARRTSQIATVAVAVGALARPCSRTATMVLVPSPGRACFDPALQLARRAPTRRPLSLVLRGRGAGARASFDPFDRLVPVSGVRSRVVAARTCGDGMR